MKILTVFFCLFFFATQAQAKIKIMACEQEWRSLVHEIAGDKVEIVTAMSALQNATIAMPMTLDMINLIQNSDFVFCSGNGLEDEWLPHLLKTSLNSKVRSMQNVMFAADYVPKVKVPVADSDGANFDYVKAQKLARVHLNPHNIPKIAAEFTRRIKIIDPINAHFYQNNYEGFVKRWESETKKWDQRALAFKGLPVVISSDAWDYLVDWLQLKVVAKVEQQNGRDPNLTQFNDLLRILRQQKVKVIIYGSFEKKNSVVELGKQMYVPALLLPFTVYGLTGVTDLFDVFENTLNRLPFPDANIVKR
jgi:zinc/manganese transport system substrate-binding protein